MISFAVIPISVFLCLLWGPTLFVILRQKSSRRSRIRTITFSFVAELIAVAILAFLAEMAGLLNPAGYVLVITLATSIVGATSVYFLSQAPLTHHSSGTPNGAP